jgi:dihydroorotate dehydrogenase electron transfer subunit
MPRVYLIWIEAPDIAAEARPGQFVTLRCGEYLLLRRPLSIHRTNGGKLALLFAVVGKGTEWLSGRMVGEYVDILGPLGNGFKIHHDSQKLLLIAGGIGIAPLVALAEEGVSAGLSVKLVIGAETASKLYPQDFIPGGVDVICITDDGSSGERGLATDLLPSLVDWADQVFVCGPVPMYRKMSEMGLGDKPIQILLEQVMGCGVGACRGCAMVTKKGIKLVCKDGPVFELGEIIWKEVKEPGVNRLTRWA